MGFPRGFPCISKTRAETFPLTISKSNEGSRSKRLPAVLALLYLFFPPFYLALFPEPLSSISTGGDSGAGTSAVAHSSQHQARG